MYERSLCVAVNCGIRKAKNTGYFSLSQDEAKEMFFREGFNPTTKGWRRQVKAWEELDLATISEDGTIYLRKPYGAIRNCINTNTLQECYTLVNRCEEEYGVGVYGWSE